MITFIAEDGSELTLTEIQSKLVMTAIRFLEGKGIDSEVNGDLGYALKTAAQGVANLELPAGEAQQFCLSVFTLLQLHRLGYYVVRTHAREGLD